MDMDAWLERPRSVLSSRRGVTNNTGPLNHQPPHEPPLNDLRNTRWLGKIKQASSLQLRAKLVPNICTLVLTRCSTKCCLFYLHLHRLMKQKEEKQRTQAELIICQSQTKSQGLSFLLLNHQEMAWTILNSRTLTLSGVFHYFNKEVIVRRV